MNKSELQLTSVKVHRTYSKSLKLNVLKQNFHFKIIW